MRAQSAESIAAQLLCPPEAGGHRGRHVGLLAPLVEAGLGWEVMDTGAACRTYNILMAEERKVAAALLLG